MNGSRAARLSLAGALFFTGAPARAFETLRNPDRWPSFLFVQTGADDPVSVGVWFVTERGRSSPTGSS